MKTKITFISLPTRSLSSVHAPGAWLALVFVAAACADDLTIPPAPKAADGGVTAPPLVMSRREGAVTETVVDASGDAQWVYLDLDRGAAVTPSDPGFERTWDLGFQRFKIKSNGGVSGGAGVEVALLTDATLTSITNAPATGWALDAPDGPDTNADPDYVFNQGATWFAYDPATHLLVARPNVYVVQTGDGNAYALQILRYYDGAGTAGHLTFRWKPLLPSPTPRVPAAPLPHAPESDAGPADGGADAISGASTVRG
ncbi:MAG TPA: HmuY family protein [Polyangia bacterium]